MRRWLPGPLDGSLIVLALVLAFVAARPVFFPPTNPRITRENFKRINVGTRWEDVEALLGPPGDYRTRPTHHIWKPEDDHSGEKGMSPLVVRWRGDYARIRILEVDGKVQWLGFQQMEPDRTGLFGLLRFRWERWRESQGARPPANPAP